MTSHRPPPPERESRWWWPIMCAAVAGVAVPPVVWSAGHVAPKVAADTSLHTFPEQVAEPSAHGGLGGPVEIPSIGALPAETPTGISTVTKPWGAVHASTGRTAPPDVTPEAATATPAATPPPPPVVTTPTQAATPTTTPPETSTPASTTATTSAEPTEVSASESATPTTETAVTTP